MGLLSFIKGVGAKLFKKRRGSTSNRKRSLEDKRTFGSVTVLKFTFKNLNCGFIK